MEQTERVSLISTLITLFLFIFKSIIAIISGSIAIKADAIHSLTDFISSLAVFAGLKISKRKSRTFPYGLHKVENLISLVISFFIFLAGYEIGKEVIFASLPKVKYLNLTLMVSLIAFLVSYFLSIYKIRTGTKTNSPSLIADGYHSRSDALSSLIVFIGLSGYLFGIQIEKIAAGMVIIFIVKSGYEILIDSLKVLLDASLDYETLNKIRKIIVEERRVGQIKTLLGRNSGRYRFIEADLTLNIREVEKAHHIVELLEQKIKKEIPYIDSIRIHYEPIKKKVLKYAVPLKSPEGEMSEHFGKAPYFALIHVDVDTNNIKKIETFQNPFVQKEKGKGIAVAEDLIERDVDFLILKKRFKGKGPEYVLADSSVEIIIMDKRNLNEVLEALKIRKYENIQEKIDEGS
ncbi:cation diffusion facilitator family transporter [Candidatus Aminicenantes bacterium AC-708-M15]|jgi:cation diffusion facilitator family transporter|nr:cation diffusion facilitator family transporter [SCandidatus Aminicenantes bacterium Aminicenantia_JdfR_composite]MCP2596485.1 cation diffusion facilitator family transporter [Candidatus Aminicenantes bacterium AC-335-G13]MCP2598128.1 cation diffusion facilitator family transporter [Candidatus Aminicenantes bacterium AC-335-L06]MCP2603881.1 cation diffusion facilitator family transporter [Candidatus Aminicenantes bacterium AC-708-M15]MCP2606516.1 cation diffusion facilitator family transport